MSRICPLFSSSSGNCTYIAFENKGILVDAGASFKGICENLNAIGGGIDEISAVFITHQHDDHIKGLKTLLSKTGANLFASEETLDALAGLNKIPKGTRVVALNDNLVEAGGIVASRFETSHDCLGSSGYKFFLPDNKKIAVCTDSGIVTDTIRSAILGCDAVLIESNHDLDMLKKGPYPPQLKVRILSDRGHLSNNDCASELKALLNSGTSRFILGHLSQHNNTPLLAKASAEASLLSLNAQNGRDYILTVAKPRVSGVTVI